MTQRGLDFYINVDPAGATKGVDQAAKEAKRLESEYRKVSDSIGKMTAALDLQAAKVKQQEAGLSILGERLAEARKKEAELAATVKAGGQVRSGAVEAAAQSTKRLTAQYDVQTAKVKQAAQAEKQLTIELKVAKDSQLKFADASKQAGTQLDKLKQKSEQTSDSVSKISGGLKALFAVAGASVASGMAKDLIMLADGYTSLDAKIKLVTDSAQEQSLVNNILYQQSQDNRELVAGNAAAYSKLQLSLRDVGVQSSETLGIVDLVGKSLKVSGASAEEASSFQLQFAQAMGSGVLQGDELRAMLESNSYFGAQLAQALGTNIAGLREMGSAGELTTDRLREAFPKMAAQIEQDFAKMPVTIQEAVNTVVNAFGKIINEGNKSADGTGAVAEAIVNLGLIVAQNQNSIADFFTIIVKGAELSIQGVSGLVGIINTLQSGINSLQVINAKTLQVFATVTDNLGLTTNAAETWGSVAEDAAIKGEAAAGRASKAFASMAGEQQEQTGKTTETLKKELLALEAVEGATKTAAAEIPTASKGIKEFADASGILETTWKNIDGVWTEVLPNGTLLTDNLKREVIVTAEATKQLGVIAKDTGAMVVTAAEAGKDAEKKAREDAKKEWESWHKTVTGLIGDIADRESSLADQLNEMERSGLSAVDVQKKIKEEARAAAEEARKLADEAQRLQEAGETAEAQNVFTQALAAADASNKAWENTAGNVNKATEELDKNKGKLAELQAEYAKLKGGESLDTGDIDNIKAVKEEIDQLKQKVTESEEALTSEKQALKSAMDGVRESGELGIEILEKQKAAAEGNRDALDKAFDFSAAEEAIDKLIDDKLARAGEPLAASMADAADSAVADLQRINDKKLDNRTVTVTVKEVTASASGSIVGAARAATGAAFSGWSDVRAGRINPGSHSMVDRIPVFTSAHEWIITSKATKHLKDNVFYPLNRGDEEGVARALVQNFPHLEKVFAPKNELRVIVNRANAPETQQGMSHYHVTDPYSGRIYDKIMRDDDFNFEKKRAERFAALMGRLKR